MKILDWKAGTEENGKAYPKKTIDGRIRGSRRQKSVLKKLMGKQKNKTCWKSIAWGQPGTEENRKDTQKKDDERVGKLIERTPGKKIN